jgi:hypothetical protein
VSLLVWSAWNTPISTTAPIDARTHVWPIDGIAHDWPISDRYWAISRQKHETFFDWLPVTMSIE